MQDAHEVTAVITGASRGLGAGIAGAFHAHGLKLGLCARGELPYPGDPRVVAHRLDVRDVRALEALASEVTDRFGRIDLWINNAGVLGPIGPTRDVDMAQVKEHLEINVLGVIAGSQVFVRHLRERGGAGVLVNVSSGAGRRPYQGWAAYCASKAAVDRFTEVLQEEEREADLRAYAVAPGVIDTAMQEQIRACTEAQFPEVERFRQLRHTGGFNTPAYVAERLLALALDPDPAVPTILDLRY